MGCSKSLNLTAQSRSISLTSKNVTIEAPTKQSISESRQKLHYQAFVYLLNKANMEEHWTSPKWLVELLCCSGKYEISSEIQTSIGVDMDEDNPKKVTTSEKVFLGEVKSDGKDINAENYHSSPMASRKIC